MLVKNLILDPLSFSTSQVPHIIILKEIQELKQPVSFSQGILEVLDAIL